VTRKATSPGELLLDVIAARILTSAAAFPHDNPEQLANAKAELRVFAAGPGDIIAALLDGIRWLPALSAMTLVGKQFVDSKTMQAGSPGLLFGYRFRC